MKSYAEAALMDTGQVYRQTFTRTASGGSVSEGRVLVETTPCRILVDRSAVEEQAGGMPEVQVVHIVAPDSCAAETGDEIDVAEQTFKVFGIFRRAPYVLKRLDCTRL